jgi:hypothetical protein
MVVAPQINDLALTGSQAVFVGSGLDGTSLVEPHTTKESFRDR